MRHMRLCFYKRIACFFMSALFLPALLMYFFLLPSSAETSLGSNNILVLNSYDQSTSWTANQVDSIFSVLKDKNYDNSLMVEYMDWKRFPTEENLQHLYNYFLLKYKNLPIDLIMTTDDAALAFALKYRSELFSEAPIVFSGVNESGIETLIHGEPDITGVVETLYPAETVGMALEINPNIKKVYLLFDNSESGLSIGQASTESIEQAYSDLTVVPMNNLSFNEVINTVKGLENDSIVLVTTYYSDGEGWIVGFDPAVKAITEVSAVPVYHLYDFGMTGGAMGGSMASGVYQGKEAAALALRVLGGEPADEIPYVDESTRLNAVNYHAMTRFGIAENQIPGEIEILERPFSFLRTYSTLVWSVTMVFAVLTSLLVINSLNLRRIKKMRCLLQTSDERYRLATDGSGAIIWDLDMVRNKYYISDLAYRILGYEKGELNEENGGWKVIVHPEDTLLADKARREHLMGNTPFYHVEYRMRRKTGEYLWFDARGKVLKDKNGNCVRFAGSLIDITISKEYEARLQKNYEELESTYEELTAAEEELKQQYDEILANHKLIRENEEKMSYIAYHDLLTGLPNKLDLSEAFESIRRSCESSPCAGAAILYIDMDNFKYINDTMGHTYGDKLINAAGQRIKSLIKPNATVYRIGGDEFLVLIKLDGEKNEAHKAADALLKGFREAFEVDGSFVHMNFSIGMVLYPEHGRQLEELLKYADIAMYQAKAEGRDRFVLYNPRLNEPFTERMHIEKYLRKAIGNNEFELYYQPQLDIKSGRITGLEALIRWHSPELGYVSPVRFIKVAEDTHIILTLGQWVLKNACAFIKRLNDKGYQDITVCVNISILQLMQMDFEETVLAILEEYGLNSQCLELEITESVLIESFDLVATKLDSLRKNGIKMALDDFGKGYSSLSYLKQLPISTLKIDKSFIDNVTIDENSGKLTGNIIRIGRSLGMSVVAEGVETQEQFNFLIQSRCQKIQGYLFSRPLPEVELYELLESQDQAAPIEEMPD